MMSPPGTLAKAAAIYSTIYGGMGSSFERALSRFGADLPLLWCKNFWLLPMPGRRMFQSSTCGCPGVTLGRAWLDWLCSFPFGAQACHFCLPMSSTSVGLHLLYIGLELGSLSTLSIVLDVMVSSGL